MPLKSDHIPAPPRENDILPASQESAETLALMARRRSTKIAHMTGPGPTGADLDALIALAGRVPDHGKLGPWRFIIIEGEARERAGEALAKVIAQDDNVDAQRLAFARSHFLRAPVCVTVVAAASTHPKIPEWEQTLSSAAACFALLMGAHAMGYAGAWLTEWPTYDARARAALGLAEHERVAGFVFLGSAREAPTERVRADVTTRISRF
jgi:nitroreductase